MIALLRGHLLIKTPQYTVIDVHGVGYKVFIPLSTFPKLPSHQEEVMLHTEKDRGQERVRAEGKACPPKFTAGKKGDRYKDCNRCTLCTDESRVSEGAGP
ncbi:MAG: hypothetical protein HZC13_00165 [Nitrospirae bacterium]|nr:hypothetical protein [Nitrospirota bacterium]